MSTRLQRPEFRQPLSAEIASEKFRTIQDSIVRPA